MKTAPKLPNRAQRGFTLIEIAIVLVIIGLLLGGVLQGQQLIENSRVKSATNDINGISAATFSYQDRYGRLPGDDLEANDDRGDSWPATGTEGDGDGVIDGDLGDTFDGGSEVGPFFQHLKAAGFLAGDAIGDTGALALPQNPFGGLIGITSATVMDGMAGNKVCMSNVSGSGATALDTQLDDGGPGTGRFRGLVGTAGANTPPDDVAITATAYSEDNIYTVCYRM
jgi:prepilin-type N-terminal cleavage/methylation domain-containing protein